MSESRQVCLCCLSVRDLGLIMVVRMFHLNLISYAFLQHEMNKREKDGE